MCLTHLTVYRLMQMRFTRLSKKFVWTVALLATIVMIIIILMMHVARKNMSGTIAIVDLLLTALFSKSDSLVDVKRATLRRSVDINGHPCSSTTRAQKHTLKALNIFTDLCDVMTGRHNGYHYDHPDIVHYVKFTDKDVEEITFQEFVSILSMHKFYRPSKIKIHSNAKKFSGKYWNLTQSLGLYIEIGNADRLRFIGQKQRPYFISHEVDALKVDIIVTKGGIFTDFDVIMVNGTKFRSKQKLAECVIGSDTDPCTRLCAGFVSCVANSSFARDWREGYRKDYAPYLWVYNAGTVPSNLLRSCPSCYNVYVDRTISLMNGAQKWLEPNGIDWKSRSVIHYMNRMFGVNSRDITPKAVVTRFNNTALGDLFMYVLGDTYLSLSLSEYHE